jgi:hypothetical protein
MGKRKIKPEIGTYLDYPHVENLARVWRACGAYVARMWRGRDDRQCLNRASYHANLNAKRRANGVKHTRQVFLIVRDYQKSKRSRIAWLSKTTPPIYQSFK